MSKIWVTNESSSFAKSFACWCEKTSKHVFVNSFYNGEYDYFRQDNLFREKEIDIFDPTLPNMISRSGAELIIHQLPITPERSKTNADYALRNNIEGSYYVIEAAKEVGIPIIFVTSKNYFNMQSSLGYYDHSGFDIYDITVQTVENILDVSGVDHISVVPPFIYGPLFDEGLSGLIKTAFGKEEVVLNINTEESLPFVHVDDFLNGLDVVVENVESLTDKSVVEIIPKPDMFSTVENVMKNITALNLKVKFSLNENLYPVMNNNKYNINEFYSWTPQFNIDSGIKDVVDKLREGHDC